MTDSSSGDQLRHPKRRARCEDLIILFGLNAPQHRFEFARMIAVVKGETLFEGRGKPSWVLGVLSETGEAKPSLVRNCYSAVHSRKANRYAGSSRMIEWPLLWL